MSETDQSIGDISRIPDHDAVSGTVCLFWAHLRAFHDIWDPMSFMSRKNWYNLALKMGTYILFLS